MASAKQSVFIPSINSKTWLLMTNRIQSTCLRDYSLSKTSEDRTFSLKELNDLLRRKDSYSERLPSFTRVPFNDFLFWREQIEFRNQESGFSGTVEVTRLQEKFKSEWEKAILMKNVDALKSLIQRWVERLSCVKDKVQFNHWDDDSAETKFSLHKGIGWTSHLLEVSRKDGRQQVISTGNDMTDFSLAAMEIGFGISSKSNLIQQGETDFIKPDGLGIRRDGCFTVIEVKGPQDERDLRGPILQAACGAAAVVAKAKMICKIAKAQGKLRPAFKKVNIPKNEPSIGIHVLTSKHKKSGKVESWSSEIEGFCKVLLGAFSNLKYIAVSYVEPEKTKGFSEIKVDHLVER